MTTLEIPYQLGRRNQILKPVKLSRKQYMFIKRTFDLLFCILFLPVLVIPMLVIYLIILLESPGSPIFVQERVGYGGRRFKMYKFRTMWHNHNDEKHRIFMQSFVAGKTSEETIDDDKVAKYKPIQLKDVTRVGKLLRKASLDEIPQIFNVIKGDMSLIGPRPNVLWEVEAYKPWHYDRLSTLPGITGLAQVMGRSEISFDEIARYDIRYVKNQALYLDFWIIWRTFKAVIEGKGSG